ncbi:ubiquinol-cytochrome C chaperone family protein [Pelagibacterium xiamenense]|uniref:ubiquinol-cytochrome C chaperone family protein n=1 Tax=Pelagibacterium xiamenense TaxID=2901140 RepID=UPI001E5496E7|nr:ubiquinol-cytochrome C chaperone family protein [Pelagibacterium xiamenense]MCD7060795.1 hypothetical protein [Pelagibacterium xiamenense]
MELTFLLALDYSLAQRAEDEGVVLARVRKRRIPLFRPEHAATQGLERAAANTIRRERYSRPKAVLASEQSETTLPPPISRSRKAMILPIFKKTSLQGPILAAYNRIVAQSRREIFYSQWGVEDSLTGRFDMLSLHMALVFRRLRREGKPAKVFSQNLFDCFFQDMDRSLREMGVGDLSVGKRIEKMGSLFYGLLAVLNEAMDSGEPDRLKAVLSRNFHNGETHPALDAFADYVLLCDDVLATQETAELLGGAIAFGEPA